MGRLTWARKIRVGWSGAAVRKLAWLSLAGFSLVAARPQDRAKLTPLEISATLALGPHAGECARCHTIHGEDQPIVYPIALIGPNDNALCDQCHTTAWEGGSFGGTLVYNGSSHGEDVTMIWPGPEPPARTEAGAASKCVNCHEPHGRVDATGLVPFLANAREEALCLTCHDGTPALSNIQLEIRKPFRHPIEDRTGLHAGPTESLPQDFGSAPLNKRHAECVDCHNPHVAYTDRFGLPAAPALSKVNLGVSRVRALNGVAGQLPAYTFAAGADTLSSPLAEYQLCFKCHSSWTSQPSGQTDLALVLNPANPSYHPVEAQGRDLMIAPGAFVAPWSPESMTRCGSCHGSDSGTSEGPHGSSFRYILRSPYTASPAPRTMTTDEICFTCHRWEVYADQNPPDLMAINSRWNGPAFDKGHAFHVGQKNVPCYSCHVTHGSTTLPHLLVTGRSPGLTSYVETALGGTCTSTCHALKTYTINYGR